MSDEPTLGDLHRMMEVGFTELRAALVNRGDTDKLEHAALREMVETERHARRKLETVVTGMLDRLEAMPRPVDLARTAEQARRSELTLARLAGLMLAAATGGAALSDVLPF